MREAAKFLSPPREPVKKLEGSGRLAIDKIFRPRKLGELIFI
jgi:hypothetical protein